MLRPSGVFSGLSRLSPVSRKSESILSRAKDKKGKSTSPEKAQVYGAY